MNERKLLWISGASEAVFRFFQDSLPAHLERSEPATSDQHNKGCLWIGASLPTTIVNPVFESIAPVAARHKIAANTGLLFTTLSRASM